MNESPGPATERDLRFLRRLVTVLTAVMIGGLLTIVALLVIRLASPPPSLGPLPEGIELPEGTRAGAITRGKGWIALVTDDQRILIYDAETGALRQSVRIEQ